MRALVPLLLLCAAGGAAAQETPEAPASEPTQTSRYFSGTITSIDAEKLTVHRALIGREPVTRVFLLTEGTRIEGKPKVKARVTVRFVSEDEVDRALYILVRATPPKK